MKNFSVAVILFTLGLCGTAHAEQSTLIRWTIDGDFLDGGYLTGGFDFDPATSTFSNITLRSFTNDRISPEVFWNYDGASAAIFQGSTDEFGFFERKDVNSPVLDYVSTELIFHGFDPSRPGPDSHYFTFEENVLYSVYDYAHHSYRTSVFGIAFGSSVSPVPEPETYALMLSGLGVMGFWAKRRKRQATRRQATAIT